MSVRFNFLDISPYSRIAFGIGIRIHTGNRQRPERRGKKIEKAHARARGMKYSKVEQFIYAANDDQSTNRFSALWETSIETAKWTMLVANLINAENSFHRFIEIRVRFRRNPKTRFGNIPSISRSELHDAQATKAKIIIWFKIMNATLMFG